MFVDQFAMVLNTGFAERLNTRLNLVILRRLKTPSISLFVVKLVVSVARFKP